MINGIFPKWVGQDPCVSQYPIWLNSDATPVDIGIKPGGSSTGPGADYYIKKQWIAPGTELIVKSRLAIDEKEFLEILTIVVASGVLEE